MVQQSLSLLPQISPHLAGIIRSPAFPPYHLVNIEYECHIFRQFEYIYADIPRRAIEFIETAYSADNFLLHTFRHPIEPSEGMWPEQWMKKRVRRRVPETSPSADQTKEDEDPNIFKRKNVQPKVAKEDLAWKRDASPRVEL